MPKPDISMISPERKATIAREFAALLIEGRDNIQAAEMIAVQYSLSADQVVAIVREVSDDYGEEP